jgi:hypothetical protein
MSKGSPTRRLHNGQVALWAVELVYPHPPQQRGNVARGSGTMAIQPDGTVCIDGSEVQLTDEWGRPFYLRLKMRVYEGLDEVVERDPHLIGAFAGAGSSE